VVQPDITAADVPTTIKKFDRLGLWTEFLTKYGYGESPYVMAEPYQRGLRRITADSTRRRPR
jgi:hypothetical protein